MNNDNMKRFVKNHIPWRLRYFIKLQEAKGNLQLPGSIKQFRTLESYNNAFYSLLKTYHIKDFKGKTVCELGPGQHLSHAFLAYQLGAVKEILLEIADFAGIDTPASYCGLNLGYGYQKCRKLPKLQKGEPWRSYLDKINAVYSTNGLVGYKAVPGNSVDYVFSFAVLEHIRKRIFVDTLKETYRFMCRGGVSYHMVDFTDHLGGRKNQLRFPASIWEDEVHYNMDNYTNRISCSQMKDIFEKIGFQVLKIERSTFKKVPIKEHQLAAEFQGLPVLDLMTSAAAFILKKP